MENLTLVNVNTSPADELAWVLGVGDDVAQAIIARRQRQPFANIAQLRAVPGVDPPSWSNARAAFSSDLDHSPDVLARAPRRTTIIETAFLQATLFDVLPFSADPTMSTGSRSGRARLVSAFCGAQLVPVFPNQHQMQMDLEP